MASTFNMKEKGRWKIWNCCPSQMKISKMEDFLQEHICRIETYWRGWPLETHCLGAPAHWNNNSHPAKQCNSTVTLFIYKLLAIFFLLQFINPFLCICDCQGKVLRCSNVGRYTIMKKLLIWIYHCQLTYIIVGRYYWLEYPTAAVWMQQRFAGDI